MVLINKDLSTHLANIDLLKTCPSVSMNTAISLKSVAKAFHLAEQFFQDELKDVFSKFGKINDSLDSESLDEISLASSKKELQNTVFEALNIHASKYYEVKCFNTIDENEFVTFTKGLEHSETVFLYGFLVKDIVD